MDTMQAVSANTRIIPNLSVHIQYGKYNGVI